MSVTPVNIVPLCNHPSVAIEVATWYHAEWGYMHPGSTPTSIEGELMHDVNSAALPLCFVALNSHDTVVGAAELKLREVAKLTEFEHWLGGVYVAAESRGQGIASLLALHVAAIAHSQYSVSHLYLQTEQPDGGLYARLGWQEVQRIYFEDRLRIVMCKQLA